MCGGILIVFLASFDSLPNWLAESYNFLIEGLNGFVHWVAVQDEFLFKEIHFSTLKVLGTYFFIIALALLLKKINYHRLVLSLVAIATIVSIYSYDEFRYSGNQLVIFQKSKKTLIGYKNGKHLTVFKSDSISNTSEIYPLKSFKTALNINSYSEKKIPGFFSYDNRSILVLDSLGVFPKSTKVHTILLTNSPKINLNRLIDSLQPNQIIADGSNYYSYVKRWEKTCKLKKLPFRYTAKQGAFPIE